MVDVAEVTNPTDFAPDEKSYSDVVGEKRRGRPVGSKNRTYGGVPVGSRRSSKGSLKDQIGALLITFNMPLMMLPMSAKYALDHTEIDALATALDTECQNNPSFRKYMVKALQVQGASSLAGVLGVIAGRRVIRAGLIPETALAPVGGAVGADAMRGLALPMMTAKPVPQMTVNVGAPTDVV